MSYIGQQPLNNFVTKQSQEFTPDGSTTGFTLDFAVTSGTDILLMINNVVQEPGAGNAYTASGTTLTMSEAPGASDNMYCIFLGLALQTVNPGDGSVGTAKLVDSAITTAKLDSSLDLSSKTITLASNMKNTPAFEAYLSSNQTISSGVNTTVAFNTEVIDTNSAYNTSTYEFTVPANQAGKYFVYSNCYGSAQASAELADETIRLLKNGSLYKDNQYDFTGNRIQAAQISIFAIMDLAVSDVIKIELNVNDASGDALVFARDKTTYFGAYRLIGV